MSKCIDATLGGCGPTRGPAQCLRLMLAVAMLGAVALGGSAQAAAPKYGFGKPATATEIAGWDIDVRPDGTGLPPGRGSAQQGQAIYDDKCASCHGTFGETHAYMLIAGGVGTLGTDQPVRSTGSKLAHATTLWDYINRAMPFNAPQTLTADEVYALTAYVLYLNNLLPLDTVLDRASLPRLRLPNRDGFTTDHGLMTTTGKPDTRNTACMRDCVKEVRVSSEMPAHARGQHGNLAEQWRNLAPTGAQVAGADFRASKSAGLELAKASACTVCHGVNERIVGPGFREIASRYSGDVKAEVHLVDKVKAGGAGTWGAVPMPAQPQLEEAEVRSLVEWILAGAK
jgi:cytochrome c